MSSTAILSGFILCNFEDPFGLIICQLEETWLAMAMNIPLQSELFDADAAVLAIQDDSSGGSVFHSSPEAGSDRCFHSSDSEGIQETDEEIFHSSSSERPAKRARGEVGHNYTFLGKTLCAAAFQKLLGVGSSSLSKIRSGQQAFTNRSRPPLPKHPQFGFTLRGEVTARWENIVMFLWCVYHSEAEVMPNRYTLPGEKTLETPFPEENERDPDAVQRLVAGFSRSLQTQGTDVDVHMVGPGTFAGPVRALPHGNRTELYWEYCAFCDARQSEHASYSSFMRVANKILGPNVRQGHLRFRKVNEHGQCDQCYKLRSAIAKAKTEESRKNARKDHHMHILSQWMDRQIYWSFRSLSQQVFATILRQSGRFLWHCQPKDILFVIVSLPCVGCFWCLFSPAVCNCRHTQCVPARKVQFGYDECCGKLLVPCC